MGGVGSIHASQTGIYRLQTEFQYIELRGPSIDLVNELHRLDYGNLFLVCSNEIIDGLCEYAVS